MHAHTHASIVYLVFFVFSMEISMICGEFAHLTHVRSHTDATIVYMVFFLFSMKVPISVWRFRAFSSPARARARYDCLLGVLRVFYESPHFCVASPCKYLIRKRTLRVFTLYSPRFLRKSRFCVANSRRYLNCTRTHTLRLLTWYSTCFL